MVMCNGSKSERERKMGLQDIIKKSKAVHLVTSSFLFGNHSKVKGASNIVSGRLLPFSVRLTVILKGSGNKVSFKQSILKDVRIYVEGRGNEISIGENVKIFNANIWIKANNSRIIIGDCDIHNNVEFGVEGGGSAIILEKNVSVGGHVWLGDRANSTEKARIYADDGKSVTVMEGTCVSEMTTLRCSDNHIIRNSVSIINPPADLTVGRHCWICPDVTILKGANIAAGCVVGTKSVVTKDFSNDSGCLIAGIPAAVIKRGIEWEL